MRDRKIVPFGNSTDTDRRINRRHFLKAGAILWGGILGGGFAGITDSSLLGRNKAAAEAIMIGAHSDVSTEDFSPEPIIPVLRIASGDTVTIETGFCPEGMAANGNRSMDWTASYKKDMAKRPDLYFLPDYAARSTRNKESFGQVCFACLINVEGAAPGDIMQIEILPDDFAKDEAGWFWADLENDTFEPLSQVKPLGVKDLEAFDPMRPSVAEAFCMPIRIKEVLTGGFLFKENHGEANRGALEKGCRGVTLRVAIRKDLKVADLPGTTSSHWVALGIRSGLLSCRKAAARKSIRLLKDLYGMLDKTEYVFCGMGANHHVSQYVSRRAVLTHRRM